MSAEYRTDVLALLNEVMGQMPGVRASSAFGFPCLKVDGRIFCFVGGDGIALKLTERRVRQLIDVDDVYRIFEPIYGTIWKAWLSIERAIADDYLQDIELFEESMRIVSAGR